MTRKGRRGNKLLTDEDMALWRHTARSLDPLREKKSRIISGTGAELRLSASSAERNSEVRIEPSFRPAGLGPESGPKQMTPPKSVGSKAPPLADFDHRAARRIRSGRIEIEARLDLHGFRQHEAHAALRSFLLSAYSRGLRWVLVITGKGGPVRQEKEYWFEPERGVLKRNVPRWLAEPELRAVVVSYTTASLSHGGEGALYIQLRARKR